MNCRAIQSARFACGYGRDVSTGERLLIQLRAGVPVQVRPPFPSWATRSEEAVLSARDTFKRFADS